MNYKISANELDALARSLAESRCDDEDIDVFDDDECEVYSEHMQCYYENYLEDIKNYLTPCD